MREMRNWLIALLVIGLIGLGIAVSRCGRVVEEDGATTTTTTVPTISAPGNLSAEAYTLQNTLTWDPVSEAASYNLYWSTSSGVTKANGTKIAGVTSPYTHEAASSPLTNGQTYYYVATAVDAASNESVDSTAVSATPDTRGITDEGFSTDGFATSGGTLGGSDWAWPVVIDSSGRLVAAGAMWTGTDQDMTIWRFNQDGTPDTSFDSNGMALAADIVSGMSEEGRAMTLDESGRIVVTGRAYNGTDWDMVVWRYNTNGSADTSFGTNGRLVISDVLGAGNDIGNGIAVDSSGNIIVAGYSRGANFDMVIWKFTSSGATVSAFGTNGIVRHNNAAGGDSHDYGYRMTLDSSGNIIVVGSSQGPTDIDMAIWKFDANGATVESFGSNGVVLQRDVAGSGIDIASALAIDTSGRIVVAGRSNNGSNNDMVVWRFNADGSTDESFASNGRLILDGVATGGTYSGGDAIWGEVAHDSSGRILVVGYSERSSGDYDVFVMRRLSDGSADGAFGENGIALLQGFAGQSLVYAYGMAIDSYGRIAIVGDCDVGGGEWDALFYRFK
jgi:uncharacterized delta-60 repeat protein